MRRFRNVSGAPISVPAFYLDLAPGEESDIDLPDAQPCPFGLEEIGAAPAKGRKGKAASESESTAPAEATTTKDSTAPSAAKEA